MAVVDLDMNGNPVNAGGTVKGIKWIITYTRYRPVNR